MAMNVFYSMVKEYAEQILANGPKIPLSANAQLCAILTKDHDIISGVSAFYMLNETVGVIPAEYMAVVAMNNAEISRALQMITLNLSDFSVVTPNPEDLYLIQSLNPENTKCNVYVSPSDYIQITNLTSSLGLDSHESENIIQPQDSQNHYENNNNSVNGFGNENVSQSAIQENVISSQSVADLFSGFGDDESAVSNAPDTNELEKIGFITNTSYGEVSSDFNSRNTVVNDESEYSSNYDVDENNPFFDNSGNSDKNNDVVYFAEVPQDGVDKPISNNYGGQPRHVAEQNLSMNDLLKQAKQKKKVAKANFNIRKK